MHGPGLLCFALLVSRLGYCWNAEVGSCKDTAEPEGRSGELPSRSGRQAGWLGCAVVFVRAHSVPETSQEFLAEIHLED